MFDPRPPHRRTLPGLGLVAVTLALVAALTGCTSSTPTAPATSATPAPTSAPARTTTPTATVAASPTPTRTSRPTESPSPHTTVSVPPAATETAPAAAHLTVTVTFAQWDATTKAAEVGGYVAGVIDDDAVCTLTLTNGADTVRQAVTAVADVSTTSCGTVSIAGSRLHTGTWTARLTYTSHSGSGTSADVSIDIP